MPQIYCHCLNVHITHKTNLKSREEVPSCPAHEFFDNDVYILHENLRLAERIILRKEVKELVVCRMIAPEWELHKCVNCDTYVYCLHVPTKSYYASSVLIGPEDAELRMQDPNFSTVYKIVLPSSQVVRSDNHGPEDLPFSIQNKYNSYIATRKSEVVEKVDRYKQELEVELNTVVNKASAERNVLLNVMVENGRIKKERYYTGQDNANNEQVEREEVDDFTFSPEHFFEFDSSPRITPEPSESSETDMSDEFDVDDIASGMHDMGIEGNSALDQDDYDVPVARSVPINMPFNPQMRRAKRKTKDKSQPPRSPRKSLDIAASMIAISKSLNPNPFGELPEPTKRSLYSRTMYNS